MPKYFYLNAPLTQQELVLPRSLARRLHRVLRYKKGQEIALFNGREGLWRAVLLAPEDGRVKITEQIKPQPEAREARLFLALAKRDAFDRAVRQATELGVTHIQPVKTEFCVADKLKPERLETIILEAAEQCERLTLPQMADPLDLKEAITTHKENIFWADESPSDQPFDGWGEGAGNGVLIGPEGGFSEEERAWLRGQKNIIPVGLGENILRVDTAVCAALTLLNHKY